MPIFPRVVQFALPRTALAVRSFFARPPHVLLTTEDVLRDEALAIHDTPLNDVTGAPLTGKALNRALNDLNAGALCLSGGGIRSASFALGVLQALAVHPRPNGAGPGAPRAGESLLSKFHYLSTVSGGGYIGSWLSAWVMRAGFATVWRKLTDRRDLPQNEADEIAWLRTYSNYLTPKLGVTSADTWAALATILRNLLLNWLVMLPVLCAALIGLKMLALVMVWFGRYTAGTDEPNILLDNPVNLVALVGLLLLVLALAFGTRNRPTRGDSRATLRDVIIRDVLPSVVGLMLLVTALLPSYLHDVIENHHPVFALSRAALWVAVVVGGALVFGLGWLASLCYPRTGKEMVGDFVAYIVAGAIAGGIAAVGIHYAHVAFLAMYIHGVPYEILLLIFGVPWGLLALLVADVIFVGLTSFEADSDSDREWLARVAGIMIVAALVWLVAMVLAFVGSILATDLWHWFKAAIAPAGGISGVIVWILGKSSLTSAATAAKQSKQPGFKKLLTDLVFAVAAAVFAVALVVLVSALIDKILLPTPFLNSAAFHEKVPDSGFAEFPSDLRRLVYGLIAVAVVGFVASKCVNINRFSLHALYRNRLIRAFLGASHAAAQRRPNPFTGFDERDNIPVWQLWPDRPANQQPDDAGSAWQPFHVINMALNIVSTKKLAWQERKAETFTVSPLHSGTACGRVGDAYPGTFRLSSEYGDQNGISLGTAMAISGAAASPNMGYLSSPSLAFLLTLFNVRLGWWLGNPANEDDKIWTSAGPRIAVKPLLNEMIGNTTDDATYIYLSDGGHFENLGLYEMVRRRCRLIVVSDAGCDPDYEFDDLGNAVRKIGLDLGVTIRFRGLSRLKPRRADDETCCCAHGAAAGNANAALPPHADPPPPFHALGLIEYPQADDGGEPGIVVFVKAGYHPERIFNAGVRNYAAANPDFPHQGTGNQFFSESQFESYRALGFEIMDELLNSVIRRLPNPGLPTIPAIVQRLRDDWRAETMP